MNSHPFGLHIKDIAGAEGYYLGVRPDLILGILYFFLMLSLVSGLPIATLFSIGCLSLVILTPAAVYILAEQGLAQSRRVALTAAVLVACSSVQAYTFYLHSLGTLSVMAVGPVAITLAIASLEKPEWSRVTLFAIVCAGMYYNYYPGVAMIAVLVAGVALGGLLDGSIRLRSVILTAGATVAVTFAVFFPYAVNVVKNIAKESWGGMLLNQSNEIQGFFGLSLTERIIPYFWGLKMLTVPPPYSLGEASVTFKIVFVVGSLLLALLLLSRWPRFSGLPRSYSWLLLFFFLLSGFYVMRQVGYGVFKLVAWGQPIVIPGMTACCLGLARSRARNGLMFLSKFPLLLLLIVAGWNAAYTIQLGAYSVGRGGGGGVQNVLSFSLQDFRDLARVRPAFHGRGIVLALSDPVLQRWAAPFLGSDSIQYLPALPLAVADSVPLNTTELSRILDVSADGINDLYLLHLLQRWPRSACGPVDRAAWKNRVFALSPIAQCRNQLILGLGWYRQESVFRAAFAWQRDFRWLRKRAEAFILNPSGDPQKLQFTLVAGHGNPSSSRDIRLFLNGRKFDEIRFSGYARAISRTFIPVAPLSQIEIEVMEDAEPLPREWALWNKQVPGDPRRLNVAIAEVSLVGDAASADNSDDYQVDFTSEERLRNRITDGIYPDRWMTREATIRLRVPPHAEAIEINGLVPGVPDFVFPYRIQVFLDGVSIGVAEAKNAGAFRAHIPVPRSIASQSSSHDSVVVSLKAPSTFINSRNGDVRPLSVRLESIALVGPPAEGRMESAQLGQQTEVCNGR